MATDPLMVLSDCYGLPLTTASFPWNAWCATSACLLLAEGQPRCCN